MPRSMSARAVAKSVAASAIVGRMPSSLNGVALRLSKYGDSRVAAQRRLAEGEGRGDGHAADPPRHRPGQHIGLDMCRHRRVDLTLDGRELRRRQLSALRLEADADDVRLRNAAALLVIGADLTAERVGVVDDDAEFAGLEAMLGQHDLRLGADGGGSRDQHCCQAHKEAAYRHHSCVGIDWFTYNAGILPSMVHAFRALRAGDCIPQAMQPLSRAACGRA